MCLIFIMFRSFVGSFCFVAEVTKRFLERVRECVGIWDKTRVDKLLVLLLTKTWNQLWKFVKINKPHIFHAFENVPYKSRLTENNQVKDEAWDRRVYVVCLGM